MTIDWDIRKDARAKMRIEIKKLLIKYNILIKELTSKVEGKNYLRIAIRNKEDNNRLLEALRREV